MLIGFLNLRHRHRKVGDKMPIKVRGDLPAKAIIEKENIFIMDENRAINQEIRPLKLALLNLMPLKEDTEIQFLRMLSNTPLQVDLTFLCVESYTSKHTPASHLNKFYKTFSEVKNQKFDGLIITGAPVEQLDFEDVIYWNELQEIMDWSNDHVTSTFHICWGAQAGLYHHYGIKKIQLKDKLFGVYKHRVLHRKVPLVRGFDDVFYAPQSRYTGIDEEAVAKCQDLKVLAASKETGSSIIVAKDGKQVFVTGHSEYDRLTLDKEYRRDLEKKIPIQMPVNYYPDNDMNQTPLLTWRANSNCLYSNWLNYYVYQVTPYKLD